MLFPCKIKRKHLKTKTHIDKELFFGHFILLVEKDMCSSPHPRATRRLQHQHKCHMSAGQ